MTNFARSFAALLALLLAGFAGCSTRSDDSPAADAADADVGEDAGTVDAAGDRTVDDRPALADCFGKPRNDEGRCDPVLLTGDLGMTNGLAASHGTAYVVGHWLDDTLNGLYAVSEGSSRRILEEAVFSFVIPGDTLAWVGRGKEISLAPLTDPSTVTKKGQHVSKVASHGDEVYFVEQKGDSSAGMLLRMRLSDGLPPLVVVTTVAADQKPSFDDSYVYYFDENSSVRAQLKRAPLVGGSEELLTSMETEGTTSDPAVTASTAFFTTTSGLRAVAKAGGASTLLFWGKASDVVADSDGSAIYFAMVEPAIAKIYRADAMGANARLLAEMPLAWPVLAVDEEALYVLDRDSGSLSKLPKE